MCEFCENNKPIYKGSTWTININKQKELEIKCNSIQQEEIELEIIFCPICGKKL